MFRGNLGPERKGRRSAIAKGQRLSKKRKGIKKGRSIKKSGMVKGKNNVRTHDINLKKTGFQGREKGGGINQRWLVTGQKGGKNIRLVERPTSRMWLGRKEHMTENSEKHDWEGKKPDVACKDLQIGITNKR